MIYKILIGILVVILPGIGYSQQANGKLESSTYRSKVQQEVAFQSSRLKLTKQQQDSVLSINDDYYSSVVALNTQSLDIKERGRQLTLLQAIQQKRLKEVLTQAQYEKYMEDQQKMKARIQQRKDSIIPKRKPFNQ